MEHLEGETLETRLKKGPLPPSDVLNYGIQIANALDRAHRSGIVHRDLKPGNVMLTQYGVKLLDFGLAKVDTPANNPDWTASSTLTGEAIMGTLAYMAPEQVEGKSADARTDIFGFGAVLFEMLTGRKAFTGDSQAALIAQIMSADPRSFASLGIVVPAALERVVTTCLAKNPDDRWQSARDIALELRFITDSPSQASRKTTRSSRIWACLVGIVIGSVGVLIPLRLDREQNASPVQLELRAPEGSEFSSSGSAISPNGRYVAFVAVTQGKQRLWLRSLGERNARPLDDTEDAHFPFWAPDSSSIGFFTQHSLKRYDLNGFVSRSLAPVTYAEGGTWSKDGVIVLCPSAEFSAF